jgi:hypothetical protein
MAARDKDDLKRVEVGFSGGQSILARISEADYGDLRRALRDGGGWYEVDSAEGVITIDLRQVVFVKIDSPEHRIGFSGT